MLVIEQILSIIAPYYCIECGQEGQVLCSTCSQNVFGLSPPYCGKCGGVVSGTKICTACNPESVIKHMWVLGPHDAHIATLISMLKFKSNRETAVVLGRALAASLPSFERFPAIVPLPTASMHVRERGYDQVRLLAHAVSSVTGWQIAPLLRRTHNKRQLGMGRAERYKQAQSAYEYCPHSAVAREQPLLLLDDVVTTGASLMAAAQNLQHAGYTHIMAAAIAGQQLAGEDSFSRVHLL